MSERLYKVVWDHADEDFDEYGDLVPMTAPEWWEAFSIHRYGEVKPYFMPTTDRIYKSRSGAVDRANLINGQGGNVYVVECTPRWQTLDDARDERARRRLHEKAQKLREQLAEVQEKVQALA